MSDLRPPSSNPPPDHPIESSTPLTQDLLGMENYNLCKYTTRLFRGYEEDKIQDHTLWECIHHDLEHYTKEIFERLDAKTWNTIKRCCYTQGYWLDHGPGKSRSSNMIKAIQSSWNDSWTMEQITYVEKTYKDSRGNGILSSWVSARKQELLPDISPASVPPTTKYRSSLKPDQSSN